MSIEIRNMSKIYGSNLVLNHLNATIEENKFTCIMGASGCGKTTLLRILMGLEQPEEGEVLGLSKKRISAVFQEERLIEHLSAMSNVLFVCNSSIDKKEIVKVFQSLLLKENIYQTIAEMSGGMKQRVAIARALLADYDVLLLDEPFKGLDKLTKEKVMKFLKKQVQGKTVIMVTHEYEEVEILEANVFSWPVV